MHEADAVGVLLAREIEQQALDGWSAADATRASEQARHGSGANASFEDWLVQRSRAITTRVAFSDTVAAAQSLASRWSAVATAAVAIAFAAGVASDAIGPAHRVNILAPPLLALLVWNLAVYVVLALRQLSSSERTHPGSLRRMIGALVERAGRLIGGATSAGSSAVLAGFARAWASASRELTAARAAAVVHPAAAALVLGALCSMYLRGLALEYRAGWESTFLDAERVHALLSLTLGAASRLSGIALPDAEQIAALRFSAGPGDIAARWIHLYAITLVLVVVVPRTVLALAAVRRARRLVRRFPLPLGDAYFERLHQVWSGGALTVQVLPYSYQLGASQRDALTRVLARVIAPQVEVALLDPAPLGAEDDLARWLHPARQAQSAAQPLLVVLFALTATPEREHHGALMRALAKRPGQRLQALVDEAGFRRRFHGAALAARLEERRHSWRAVLADAGVEPVFIDLAPDTDETNGAGTVRHSAPSTTNGDRS